MIIRFFRRAFRVWPFLHGRGWILRLARLLLGSGPIRFDIGDGSVIEGSLDDWMILWAFMGLHERDAAFQRSLALIRPGDVAVDVGAHAGVWSLLAARRGAARVHAFEAVPEMAARLREHVRLSGLENIVVHAVAAGAENGSLPFFAVREGNSGASSFARSDAGEEIRVPVVTLDASLDRADVLKVDVEGAEILVFRGACRLLSGEGAPAVFFEMDDDLCARFGVSGREVKQFLADRGYRLYRWRHSALRGVSVDEPHGHEDLFALKS